MERTEALITETAPSRDIPGSYIDWAAIIAGALVAAAIAGLFMTFGASLGLSAISARPGEGSFDVWVIVTGLWLVVTLVVSYLAGGYIAGRMRRRVDAASTDETARDGINGLVVWALGMLLTAWMAASVLSTAATTTGQVADSVAQAAGSALGGAAQGLGSAIPDDGTDTALSWINDTLGRPVLAGQPAAPAPGSAVGMAAPVPAESTQELARQSGAILANAARTGEISEEDHAYLVAATARITGLSEAEAQPRVEDALSAAQSLRNEAQQLAADAEAAARDAAETARVSAILTAFILTAAALVAGVAAMMAAVRGGRHRDEGRMIGNFGYHV